MGPLAVDPNKPIFWWLFAGFTAVSIAPVALGALLIVSCKVGSCAAEGLSLSLFRVLMVLSTWIIADVSPRLAAAFQLLAPVSTVALGMLAGASASRGTAPGSDPLRRRRNIFASCFGVTAVVALINLGFYSPSDGAPINTTEIARLIGNAGLVSFIIDSNSKALQMALPNLLVLFGIVRLKQSDDQVPGRSGG